LDDANGRGRFWGWIWDVGVHPCDGLYGIGGAGGGWWRAGEWGYLRI